MKGQILLEVLVALGVAVIVVSSITGIIVTSLSQAESSQNQNKATRYAQQGMEILKNMKNSKWTNFSGLSGTYCMDLACTSLNASQSSNPNCWITPPSCNKIEGVFTRTITIDQVGCANNGGKVTVDVSWSDGKCQTGVNCHKSEQASCFYNIQTIPSP